MKSSKHSVFWGRWAVVAGTVALCVPVEVCLTSTSILRESFDNYPPGAPFFVDGLPPAGSAGHTNYLGEDALWMQATFPVSSSFVRTFVYPGEAVKLVADSVSEFRVDVLQFESASDYVEFGFADVGDPDWVTYTLMLNANDLIFEKSTPFRPVTRARFLVESGSFKDDQVAIIIRLMTKGETLEIQIQLLDKENSDAVLFDRTILDTPDQDPVFPGPARFRATTPDLGRPFLTDVVAWFGIASPSGTGTTSQAIFDNYSRTTTALGIEEMMGEVFVGSNGTTLPYRLWIPEQYDPSNRYPLVMFLHGMGEIGTDNRAQVENTPGFLAFASDENQRKQPCFLLAPQAPGEWLAIADRVIELLTDLQSRYALDPDRCYITGLSMGGWGTTDLVAYRPDVFAAAVPMSSASSGKAAQIAHIPTWAFCGAQDGVVNNVRLLVDNIREAGGQAIYTEYSRVGHAGWTSAYQTPGLYDWLMAQRRGTAQTGLPVVTIQAPTTESPWISWSTACQLKGEVSADLEATRVDVENVASDISLPATGINDWSIPEIQIVRGATNVLVVKATGPSRASNAPGSTTASDTLVVVQKQLVLEASIEAGGQKLRWTPGTPACVIQRTTELTAPLWVDVETNTTSEAWFPWSGHACYYRLRIQ